MNAMQRGRKVEAVFQTLGQNVFVTASLTFQRMNGNRLGHSVHTLPKLLVGDLIDEPLADFLLPHKQRWHFLEEPDAPSALHIAEQIRQSSN